MARNTQTYRSRRRNRETERAEATPDERIIQRAKDRFKRVGDWESPFWQLYVTDVKFALGDSDNGWQWPDDLRKDRETNKRPTLTINKTGPLCRLITNDQRQNKSSVTIRPANNDASYQAAEGFEGLIRQIEYDSNAQAVFDDAGESQVEGGLGYWRIKQEYIGDDTFDQKLLIAPVPAHRNVYLDCDIKQKDGADAKWGFIFDDVPDEEFEASYPNLDVSGTASSMSVTESDDWTREGYTRVAEYYEIEDTDDMLIWMEDEEGNDSTFRRSELPPGTTMDHINKMQKESPDRVMTRKIKVPQLWWYKLAGSKIVDRRKLKGKYVPIIRCAGIERVIDSKLERKGHVRGLKDAQRMYNYNTSGHTEFVALQTKTPWIVAAAAIQGNETAWQNANRSNYAYLTYKHMDDDENELPAPQRAQPPSDAPGFLRGIEIADKEMMMASGQWHESQGQSNDKLSGKAIGKRQRQGETAIYHFIDNMALAIRHTGVVLLDLIPHVYNTKRVAQILGKDGKQTAVQIDPKAEKSWQEQPDANDQDQVLAIFNPTMGQYGVVSDPGPSYATRRQEAWEAMIQIIIGSPELINDIGDFMFQQADFPLADKIAERLRAKIRKTQPWLLDDEAPGPFVQQLQQQVQQLTQQTGELLEKLADSKRALRGKDQKRDVEAYRAESDRIRHFGNTVKDLVGDPEAQRKLIDAMTLILNDIYGEDIAAEINREQDGAVGHAALHPDAQDNDAEGGEQPPVPNARKAKDGNWYVPDPSRKGKWLRVAQEQAA